MKINKLLFVFFLFFLLQPPSAHTWLSSNAHKYEKVKRWVGEGEKKAEENECRFAIYQDRSIDNSIS